MEKVWYVSLLIWIPEVIESQSHKFSTTGNSHSKKNTPKFWKQETITKYVICRPVRHAEVRCEEKAKIWLGRRPCFWAENPWQERAWNMIINFVTFSSIQNKTQSSLRISWCRSWFSSAPAAGPRWVLWRRAWWQRRSEYEDWLAQDGRQRCSGVGKDNSEFEKGVFVCWCHPTPSSLLGKPFAVSWVHFAIS